MPSNTQSLKFAAVALDSIALLNYEGKKPPSLAGGFLPSFLIASHQPLDVHSSIMSIHPDDILTFREAMRLIVFHSFAPIEIANYVCAKMRDCHWTIINMEAAFKFWRNGHSEKEFLAFLEEVRTPVLLVHLPKDYPRHSPVWIPE